MSGKRRLLIPDGSLIKPNHIILDQNLIDPSKMIYGDVNSEAIQWIRANSHRYLGKYTGEGQMTICQLSDTNPDGYVAFHDGTGYLSGNEGDGLCDWWMRLPKFYYHAEEVEPDIWDIGFGAEPEADDWKCWDGNDLIGVFKALAHSGYMISLKEYSPAVSFSQIDFKTMAQKRGDGYSLVKFKHHSMMAFLFYAMYGNTNCQAICGAGTSERGKTTGQTDLLGMTDTVAYGNGSLGSINFWGLENWWGDIYEWVDNVSINNNVWTITEDDGSTRNVQAYESNGYILKVSVGENLDMVPTAVDATNSIGFCDLYGQSSRNAIVLTRSYFDSLLEGGVACVNAVYDASSSYAHIGSRLAFRGDIIVEDDVQAFRSIPITNLPISPVSPTKI